MSRLRLSYLPSRSLLFLAALLGLGLGAPGHAGAAPQDANGPRTHFDATGVLPQPDAAALGAYRIDGHGEVVTAPREGMNRVFKLTHLNIPVPVIGTPDADTNDLLQGVSNVFAGNEELLEFDQSTMGRIWSIDFSPHVIRAETKQMAALSDGTTMPVLNSAIRAYFHPAGHLTQIAIQAFDGLDGIEPPALDGDQIVALANQVETLVPVELDNGFSDSGVSTMTVTRPFSPGTPTPDSVRTQIEQLQVGVYVPVDGQPEVVGVVPVLGTVDGGKYTLTVYISAVDGRLVHAAPTELHGYTEQGLVNAF